MPSTLGAVVALLGLVTTAFAYEEPVHLWLTAWLSDVAGFSSTEALEIAMYDQATDDDPKTNPLGVGPDGVRRRADFHFVSGSRLHELERKARSCYPGQMTPPQLQAIGQYLHALEDVYSHRSYGPRLGHAVTLHTPDKPWSNPAGFVEMVLAKFDAILALRSKCSIGSRSLREGQAEFARVRPLLDAWKDREYDAGVDDPESPSRFDTLTRQLYGAKYDLYVTTYHSRYDEWRQRRAREGWRSP